VSKDEVNGADPMDSEGASVAVIALPSEPR
jgi:hypothetical protein